MDTGSVIQDVVVGIAPYDDVEAEHRQDVLEWIASGVNLCRIDKPDKPPKHLVSYFVVWDEQTGRLLLIDHAKAQLWLPTGGHVEPNEHPRDTVVREALEELGIAADFSTTWADRPLFLTVNTTIGYGNHTDVSLWYVIKGDSTKPLALDQAEIRGYCWLTPEEVLGMDIARLDRHMHRFVRKMRSDS